MRSAVMEFDWGLTSRCLLMITTNKFPNDIYHSNINRMEDLQKRDMKTMARNKYLQVGC